MICGSCVVDRESRIHKMARRNGRSPNECAALLAAPCGVSDRLEPSERSSFASQTLFDKPGMTVVIPSAGVGFARIARNAPRAGESSIVTAKVWFYEIPSTALYDRCCLLGRHQRQAWFYEVSTSTALYDWCCLLWRLGAVKIQLPPAWQPHWRILAPPTPLPAPPTPPPVPLTLPPTLPAPPPASPRLGPPSTSARRLHCCVKAS